jgi:hypothetical protein
LASGGKHDRLTVASLAIIAGTIATTLHEGVGHGVVAWLRGDLPTQLTSNHLSSEIADRWVSAGGTIVNLVVGAIALVAMRAIRSSTARFGVWLVAAFNLLPGAGYFLFSGAFGVGDWSVVIAGTGHEGLLRVAMVVGGGLLYVVVVWRLARAIVDYVFDAVSLWIIPYLAAAIVECAAGAFDPLGLNIYLLSTIPATFGGSSGLVWGHRFIAETSGPRDRVVGRRPVLWAIAAAFALAFIGLLGPGLTL